MRFSYLFSFLAFLAFAACTSAVQKSENRWEVKVKKESDNRVWVSKADGSKQCESPSKLTPKAAAQEVTAAGVVVFNARSGTDGRMRVTKCGAPTGKTVDLEISEMDLGRIRAFGYSVKTM
ncbi:MAG: hypothetical protein AB7K68_05780 [Bacteriovoracia bacterium]